MLQMPVGDVEIEPGSILEWRMVSAESGDPDRLAQQRGTTTYNQVKHFAAAQSARIANDTISTYVAGTFEIPGVVDRPALESALLHFVRRHEVLRCTFQQLAGDLSCDILDPDDVKLEVIDRGSVDSPTELRAFLGEFFQSVDTLSWPLILMGAVVRDGSSTVFFACDHIVTDGLSTPIAVNDIATSYAAFSRGREPELPEVGSYLAFSCEQRGRTESLDIDDSRLDHWKTFIARGGTFFPPFPLDLGVEPGCMYPTVNETVLLLAGSEVEALEGRCRAADGRLFMGILAALGVSLRREGGPDVYRGFLPVNERGRGPYAHTMGWFINTMPIEFSVAEDQTFTDVIDNVRVAAADMRRNADVPFVKAWHLLAPAEHSNLRYWPYAVNFFSYLDFRRSPGSQNHAASKAGMHIWASRSNGISFWFHRNDAGLYVNSISVDTPQAHRTKSALAGTLTRTLESMARSGRF